MTARLDVEINSRGAKAGAREVNQALDSVKTSARQTTTAVNLFQKSLIITAASAAFTVGLSKATSASGMFADALAEVNTLLDETPGQLDLISEAAKQQAFQFGSLPVDQTKAFYQIISAGAADAAEATLTLTAANKLAVGGVTDVTIAADVLTSTLNVYGDAVGGASDVTDTLFIGMREGKTTIGELASEVGKVLPLAENLDIAFTTLVAATAALTKGGISTSRAITGLQGIMTAVVKPTAEAVKEAAALDLQFNALAVQTLGLSGFLEELARKTGGNTETLAKLFGNVEALLPVLNLAGSGAADFAEILDAMNDRLGATEIAFQKVSAAPGFASKQLRALGAVILTEVGDTIGQVLVPALQEVLENFDEIIRISGVVAISLTAAFGPQIAVMIGTQFVAAVGLATGAITTLTAAIAANPIGAILVAITASISALILFSDRIKLTSDGMLTLRDVFVTIWNFIVEDTKRAIDFWVDLFASVGRFIEQSVSEWVGPVEISMTDMGATVKTGVNAIIGLFVGAFGTISENWGLLPDFFSSVMVKTVNAIISGVETTINVTVNAVADFLEEVSRKTIAGINFLLAQANRIPLLDLDLLIEPEFKENEFNFAFDRITDQAEGTATKIGENIQKTWETAFSTDFIGDFVTEFQQAVEKTASIRREAERTSRLPPQRPAAPGAPPTPGAVSPDLTAQQLSVIQAAIDGFIGEAETAFNTLAGGYAERLGEMVDATKTAASEMGVAFAEVFGPGGTLQRGFADSAARAIVFGDDLRTSLINVGKQITAQLISKFIQTQLAMLTVGRAAESMAATTSTAIVAGNTASAASGIASQQALTAGAVASNQAIAASAAPAAATTSIATSGGSAVAGQAAFTAAIITMLALVARANGLLEFANGGVFSNRVVDRPTAFPLGMMGEAGPEAILPLARNARGQLGVLAPAVRSENGATVFAPVINVRVEGGRDPEETGRQTAGEVKRQLELTFSEFLRRQQRSGGLLNRQREF